MTETLLRRSKSTLGLIILGAISISASAATIQWTGSAGADLSWTNPLNWTPNSPPTSLDAVIFNEAAASAAGATANVNNRVTGNAAIQSLRYIQASGTHYTSIDAGSTLKIDNNGVGSLALSVGGVGAGAEAKISGEGSLVVDAPGANVSVDGNGEAELDVSGLRLLSLDAARVEVGASSGGGDASLSLAVTSTIRAAGASPAIEIGGNGSASLLLGLNTTIKADSISVGADAGAGSSIRFNGELTASGEATLNIRGLDGESPAVELAIGDGLNASGGATVDLSGGAVDAKIETVVVGRASASAGGGVSAGELTFDDGTIEVEDLRIGVQGSAGAGAADGAVNVNGDAELVVTGTIELGPVEGGAGASLTSASLAVNGGSVVAASIEAGAESGTSLSITDGQLTLTGQVSGAGSVEAPIDSVTFSNATIVAFGRSAKIVADTLKLEGSNTLNVSGLAAITTFPATIEVIQYGTLEGGFNLTLGPLPAGFTGTLVNNAANGSIDLMISAGPIPATLTWTGDVDPNWDLTTANWKAALLARTFAQGDVVLFGDSASAEATVNLVGDLKPGLLIVHNSNTDITFAGPGGLSGTASLTKNGSGALTLANTGANVFGGGVIIQQGTLAVGDGGANGSLSTELIVNNGSLVFDTSNDLVVDAVITGVGSVTVNGGGSVTLSGANAFLGATLVNDGELIVNGELSDTASVTVGSSGTLSGSATIGGDLMVSAGATLAPGDGIGRLTVDGDAVLEGTTEIEVDAARSTSDVIEADSITLGGTLKVNLTGGAAAGGQEFKILSAASIAGSFTAIIPETPGPGQVWDTAKLAVDGILKVVGDVTLPEIELAAVVGANIDVSGSGGAAGASYQVLGSSDLNIAVEDWSVVASGTFDANGDFSVSVPAGASASQFLVLRVGGN